MQRFILLIVTLAGLLLGPSQASFAADLNDGAKVFSVNCAACHGGGVNVVNAAKTLRKEALEQFEMASMEAIQTQVTNGKNAMPAFAGRLTPAQIENVAAYVLNQAEQGW